MQPRATALTIGAIAISSVSVACNKNLVLLGGRNVSDRGSGDSAADCSNERDICGNFSQTLRELCRKNGGGEPCSSNRWDRQFFNDLVNEWRGGHSERPTEEKSPVDTLPVPPPSAANRSLAYAKVENWPNEWNIHIADVLDGHARYLLSSAATISDLGEVCPKYNSITASQRKIFWALFVSSIAEFESGKNPKSCYREDKFSGSESNNPYFTKIWVSADPKPTRTLSAWLTRCHEPQRSPDVYSEGLLQLSYGDEEWSPGCEISPAKKNIRDPKVNLQCGMIIMSRSVKRYHRVFLEHGKAYWSVLFPDNSSRVIRHFKEYSSSYLPFCR